MNRSAECGIPRDANTEEQWSNMNAIASQAGGGRAAAPRVLITAGPTIEDIDPVRFITNRSSGRMGIQLALAVRRAGGLPRLLLGPTPVSPPGGFEVTRVRSAADMCRAVLENFAWCDSLVMAAAVADYTPAEPLDTKLKKGDGDFFLRLKRTQDILSLIKEHPERPKKFVVGFSLDVDVNLDEGRRKLAEKGLDLIVVNTVESFGASREVACILAPADAENCAEIGKEELAGKIVSRILSGLAAQSM